MTPQTLDAVKAITNPVDRAVAAIDYIKAGKTKISEAVRVKDDAITELLDQGNSVATICAVLRVSGSQVKAIRRLKAVPQ